MCRNEGENGIYSWRGVENVSGRAGPVGVTRRAKLKANMA